MAITELEDGFWLVEIDGRRLDVCVIGGAPRYIRSHDGVVAMTQDGVAALFDRLSAGEGTWREAAKFDAGSGHPLPPWSIAGSAAKLVRELAGEPMPESTYEAWISLAYNLRFSGMVFRFNDPDVQRLFDEAIEARKKQVAAAAVPN